jgi:hypothetical protein
MGMERLEPLIGEWDVETSFAPPGAVRATATFEWALGRRFVLQRMQVDLPEAPDGLMVISPSGDGFTQHYFDSRGVVRVYAMTFDGRTWTLQRDAPDFSPLDFAQRYAGVLSEDGARIEGRWHTRAPDASEWARDFDLTYVRRR